MAGPRPLILLGVTGSVAAYKALDLIRRLRRFAEVRVVATEAALRLVSEARLRRESGHPVGTGLFDGARRVPPDTPSGSHPLVTVPHIEHARGADLVLIAPATANVLAKLAHGVADDLLTTACLYARCPLWVAPAMNTHMWRHPAVRDNVRRLRRRGVRILGPESGHLACGETGEGRFVEPWALAAEVRRSLPPRTPRPLEGVEVLVTAGPTREPLDPVRFLSNRSSGKMGYAVAEAAALRGARVALVSGPTALPDPPGVHTVRVETARAMARVVRRLLPRRGLAVMAAAVSDYRPLRAEKSKRKKDGREWSLRLVPNPDLLGEVLALGRRELVTVGFAAETGHLETRAREKWRRKPCDLLAANRVGRAGTGFDAEENEVLLFVRGRRRPRRISRRSKFEVAEILLDEAARLLTARRARRPWKGRLRRDRSARRTKSGAGRP